MNGFLIFFIVTTSVLLVYYAVVIYYDIRPKEDKDDDVEVFEAERIDPQPVVEDSVNGFCVQTVEERIKETNNQMEEVYPEFDTKLSQEMMQDAMKEDNSPVKKEINEEVFHRL